MGSLNHVIRLTESQTNFHTISINSNNPNGTAIQELVDLLNEAVSCFENLSMAGISAERIAENITLEVIIGNNYFFEIAKLKAIRILFYQLAKIYEAKNFSPSQVKIHCTTALLKDKEQINNNMLSNTTQAMAAIIGGCDSLCVKSHDVEEGFSNRIARNVSSILKEESYLDKVADPAAGSYYIEVLTDKLVKNAWDEIQNLNTSNERISKVTYNDIGY